VSSGDASRERWSASLALISENVHRARPKVHRADNPGPSASLRFGKHRAIQTNVGDSRLDVLARHCLPKSVVRCGSDSASNAMASIENAQAPHRMIHASKTGEPRAD